MAAPCAEKTLQGPGMLQVKGKNGRDARRRRGERTYLAIKERCNGVNRSEVAVGFGRPCGTWDAFASLALG